MSKKTDNKGHVLKKGERQRKDNVYEFRIYRGGKSYSVFAMTLTELRLKKEKLLKQLESGIDIDKQKLLFDYYANEYLKAKSLTLEKSTFSTMRFMYDKYIKSELGFLKIAEIKRSTIKKYYLGMLTEKKLAISTISRLDSIITPIFESALNDDIISKNPARGVCGEIKKETHAKTKEIDVLTPEELNSFMDFILNNPIYNNTIKNLLVVLSCTGMRVGEVTALTWDNIDFKSCKISVCKSIAYIRDEDGHAKQLIKEPKTLAGIRNIPMLKAVKKAFLSEREHQLAEGVKQPVLDDVTNFCFLSNRNTPYTRDAINAQIKKMLKDYNAQCKNEKEKL
ncbi:integrase DNA-binding domain-containing protein, partial [bacterium]|nr:integrase DNA-binding domain-containing protein [bacterium]